MIRKRFGQRSVGSIILSRDRYLVWMVFLVVRVLPTYLPRKFKGVLNRCPNALQTSFYSTLQSSVTDTLISEVYFSEEDVVEAIHELNPNKYDAGGSTSSSLLLSSRSLLLHFSLLLSDTGICQVAFVTASPHPY